MASSRPDPWSRRHSDSEDRGTLELDDKDLPVGLDLDGWASGLLSVVVAGGNGGEGGAGGRGGDGGRGVGGSGGDAQGHAFSRAVEIEGNRGAIYFGDVVAGDGGSGSGGRAGAGGDGGRGGDV